jgi:hypothetical protein
MLIETGLEKGISSLTECTNLRIYSINQEPSLNITKGRLKQGIIAISRGGGSLVRLHGL